VQSSTDDLLVATTDQVTDLSSFTTTDDPLTISLGESTDLGGNVNQSAADPITLGVTDVVTEMFVTIDTGDILIVSVGDTPATEIQLGATDTVSVGITDANAGLLVDQPSTDTVSVGITDTSAVELQFGTTDTVSVGVTEGTSDVITAISASDTLNVGITDAISGTISGVATATDAVTLSITETATNNVPILASDTLFVGINDGTPVPDVSGSATDPLQISLVELSDLNISIETGPPPDEILYAAIGPFTRVIRRVDIYESDGLTPFMLNAPFSDGNVNCDMARSERRIFDLQLANIDGALDIYPEGIWYNKIVKIYRGIESENFTYMRQLIEGMIDSAEEPHFPNTLSINGRDYTKKLLTSKFPTATAFPINTPIENIIETIAINGGISPAKINLPLTGKSTGRDFFFERQTERWKAMAEIANSYGYDIYFTHDGFLTMEEFADPTVDQPDYVFETGPVVGNLSSISKRTGDARMYNHVVVTGESSDTIPVWAEVKNEVPGHPTSIAEIGERTYFYTSSFITTYAQALDVATKFLKIHALEQFELGLEAIVIPWLEVGNIVDFIDPNPAPGDPDRFLFSDCTIPLALKTMPAGLKRVTAVV
jgi:hypothetical protein